MDGAAARSLSLRVLNDLKEDAERLSQTFGGAAQLAPYYEQQRAFFEAGIQRCSLRLELINDV